MIHKVELSEKDMQEAIKDWVRKQTGHDVTTVYLSSTTGDRNMGRDYSATATLGAKRA